MDRDEESPDVQRVGRAKEPLARLTEWRVPSPPPTLRTMAEGTRPRLSPHTLLLIVAPLALILAFFGLDAMFSKPKVSDLVEQLPVAKEPAPVKRRDAPTVPSSAPVTLPSGLAIDHSSRLNYDLAAWLATTPTAPRTFTFDRLRFDPGSASVYESETPMLQVLSQILTAYPQAKVVIIASGPGSLGLERANAIRSALLALAADPDQLSAAAGDTSESPPKLSVKLELGVGNDLDA